MHLAPSPEVLSLAHPIVGSAKGLTADELRCHINRNVERAERWFRWLVIHIDDIRIACSWLTYVRNLEETAVFRARGLRDSGLEAASADGIVICGGDLSSGMRHEVSRTLASRVMGAGSSEPDSAMWSPATPQRYVLDLIDLGDEPPEWPDSVARSLLADRLAIARRDGSNGPTTEHRW